MKVYVDKMPKNNEECLFHAYYSGYCSFNTIKNDRSCKLKNGKCPYLKVYEKPASIREYPSYFNNCC